MSLLTPSRRGFLAGIGALFAAPAIVRASSLMPVKAFVQIGEIEARYLGLTQLKTEGATMYFDDRTIADLLLPGLRTYPNLPRQWPYIFRSAV
jgi:hypothetical protein